MRKRKKNEKEFNNWEETPDQGRFYWKDIHSGDKSGKIGRYEKEVDKNEETLSFTQKIFDKEGNLIEIHEKYPVDKGHIVLGLSILLILGITILNYI